MKLIVKLGAAAAAMVCMLTGGAAMAQPYDDPGYDAIQRQRQRAYCYNHPYSERCGTYRHRTHRYRYRPRKRYSSRCARSRVHAVGKPWVFIKVARNSAIKAWEKEARVDFGWKYANWSRAKKKWITCGPSGTGIGTLCEAKGRPCR
jgi:hypothetical protein